MRVANTEGVAYKTSDPSSWCSDLSSWSRDPPYWPALRPSVWAAYCYKIPLVPADPQTPLADPQTPLTDPQTSLTDPQTPPVRPQTPQTGPQPPCIERGQMDGCTDGHTEFLPILQHFVPYWGRCPATL